MSAHTLGRQDSQKLAELIRDIHVAMITTVAPDGSLHSRPMANPNHGFYGELWFFTSLNSPKSEEVAKHSQVNVSFSEPKSSRYVSISGAGTIVQDAAKIKELWNPLLKAWFPGGPEDANLALLRIEVDHVEYWDAKSSHMQVFLSLAKAAVTGEPPKHLGDHQKLA